jgi:hypothetical protein
MLGVAEYFLYDPRAEYLEPSLQGFRLVGGAYRPIPVDDRGELLAETLGLAFFLDENGLIALRDRQTGQVLLRVDAERERIAAERDAERERAETEKARAETEKARAEAAERRLAEVLAEIEKRR